MSRRHSLERAENWRSGNMAYKNEFNREVPGIILMLFFAAVTFGIIYFLGSSYWFLGPAGAIAGVFMGSLIEFLFSSVNRRRRLDHVAAWFFIGALIGLGVNYVLYFGNIIYNLATASEGVSFFIELFVGIVVLVFLVSGVAISKSTDLR